MNMLVYYLEQFPVSYGHEIVAVPGDAAVFVYVVPAYAASATAVAGLAG
jgi:hypothetical protein